MKKAVCTAAIFGALLDAVLAGNVLAADVPLKAPLLKAPAPAYSWTGCYLGGGGGYGVWNQDSFLETDPAHQPLSNTATNGGRGWFGTVAGGCDYQVNSNIVVGAFADGDWGRLSGIYSTAFNGRPGSLPAGNIVLGNAPGFTGGQGTETEQSAWAVGGRLGWLVTPTVLTFWDGGYTQARFGQMDLASTSLTGFPVGRSIVAQTYSGWFLGGGLAYALPFFPGLFLQTEYRYASYRAADIPVINTIAPSVPTNLAINSQVFVQTVRTDLVYRFSWGR